MNENIQENTAINFLDNARSFINDTRNKIDNVMTKAKENGLTLPKVRQIDSAGEAISGIGKIIGSGKMIGNKIWGGILGKVGNEVGNIEKEIKKVNEEINGNNIEQSTEENGNNIEQSIEDKTTNNETPSIRELWEREDEIRKETQTREDNAYQRAVEDMRKAGINPNLVGVNPASSGGGIIQATGQNLISTEMSGIINEAIAEINNTVKADEGQKNRITDIIRSLAQLIIMVKLAKK